MLPLLRPYCSRVSGNDLQWHPVYLVGLRSMRRGLRTNDCQVCVTAADKVGLFRR